jgi:hypothetical protein
VYSRLVFTEAGGEKLDDSKHNAHSNRVDIFFHGDPDNGEGGGSGGNSLPADFADQVYKKLDWIIGQNEQILAGQLSQGVTQEQIDNFTAQVKSNTESLAQKRKELEKKIEENKQDAN